MNNSDTSSTHPGSPDVVVRNVSEYTRQDAEAALHSAKMFIKEREETKATFMARLEGRFTPDQILKIKLAYVLAKYGHRGQQRKERDAEGRKVRYFEHVRRVAVEYLNQEGEFPPGVMCWEGVCIALLHDVFEDTEDITPELVEMMFGENVCFGVICLTKRKGLKTSEYQMQLMRHKIAPYVKLCDRVDNMRHCRIEFVGEEFRVRQKVETREEWLNFFAHLVGTAAPLYQELKELVKKA